MSSVPRLSVQLSRPSGRPDDSNVQVSRPSVQFSSISVQLSRPSVQLSRPPGRWQHEHGRPHEGQNESADLADGENDVWIIKTQQQIEYYFSDRNLQRDKFLLSKTGPAGTDFVELEVLCTFAKLKKLGTDSGLSIVDLVRMAVDRSADLELSEDKLCLRRFKPLPSDIRKAQARVLGTVLIGSEPNIFWCHVTMDELRSQERFLALPLPSDLKINGPVAWSWVRQDDELWDRLHWGVLSTRHLKGIFGFHEPQAAAFLGLARNMIDHDEALGAYQDLLEAAEASAYHPQNEGAKSVQAENESRRHAFNERKRKASPLTGRHVKCMRRCSKFTSIGQVRCAWGSAQEAAALKQLLDAPEIVAAGGILEEVGLCMLDPGRLAEKQSHASTSAVSAHQSKTRRWGATPASKASTPAAAVYPPLMGASPDAMLRFSNGDVVSVEVKNVCPFFDHKGSLAVHDSYVSPDDRSTVPYWRLRGPADSLPTAYIPQAQWEMFTTDTETIYFVSASALQGINVFVLERDESYIDLMLQVISDFYQEFVLAGRKPGENFFWDRPYYMELLDQTRRLCSSASVSFRIPPRPDAATCGLFLDQARQISA